MIYKRKATMREPATAVPERSMPIRRKKPVFGILSFVAILIVPLLYILAFVIGFPKDAINPGQGYQAGLAVAGLVYCLFLATIGSSFITTIGLIFGIIGIVQKNRNKVFAIIGTTINGLLFSGFLFALIMIRLSRD